MNKISEWLDKDIFFFTKGNLLSIPFVIIAILIPVYFAIPSLMFSMFLGFPMFRYCCLELYSSFTKDKLNEKGKSK